MNIFILHYNNRICAIYHNDKHVVKMILEYAQILCTTQCVLDGTKIEKFNKNGKQLKPGYTKPNEKIYKPTHINHPCTIWTRESSENYMWLYNLFINLCDEYTYRYGKIHLCDQKFRNLLVNPPKNIKSIGLTRFPLAMPDECKIKRDNGTLDTIESYRNYYIKEKSKIANWKKNSIPTWYKI